MNKLIFLFIVLSFSVQSQDFGDESDGVCTFTGLQAKATWNCTDITVTGNTTFPGVAPVILRATGNVTINVGFTVSVAGSTLTAGPGGSNGADCNVLQCNSINGAGTGSGFGGGQGNDNTELAGAGGGGGGGGTYNGSSPGTNGQVGQDDGISTATGGSLGSVQAAGYGSNTTLDSNLLGGSGGGAGGTGEDASGNPDYNPGGDGGGGGGAIGIIAQGSILVNGNISANGGDGQDGFDNFNNQGTGGGGGGGSGGSIYIYTASSITVNAGASISAIGGTGGAAISAGASTILGGNGGDGGKGRIRIDSLTGSFSGAGSVDPSPYQVSNASSNGAYKSDIDYSCIYARIENNTFAFIPTMLFGFLLVFGFSFILRKYRN